MIQSSIIYVSKESVDICDLVRLDDVFANV